MSDIYNQILVASTSKALNTSKITGKLDLTTLSLYEAYLYYYNFSEGKEDYTEHRQCLQEVLRRMKSNNPELCDYKKVLPLTSNILTGEATSDNSTVSIDNGGPGNNNLVGPILLDFTVNDLTEQTLFGSGQTFPTYNFSISDVLDAYSNKTNSTFQSLIIDLNNLDGGFLKFNSSPTTGNIYGEGNVKFTIPFNDISKWSWYTSSTSQFEHGLTVQISDVINAKTLISNTSRLTVDRPSGENQPATIGDNTIEVTNRAITTFNLSMFTSQLAPPYNDPEGDLIDAIRIDEISTANKGVFKLNGTIILDGQIITRENIQAGQFTHEAPDLDSISSDTFSFSARDEGSQIWVQ